jgi:toxin-antitoxin system PIN domain toxin
VRTTLLDVNVLLALTWPNHQHHGAAHEWFGRESRHGWATCALTQLAFIRLSSNPVYTPAAVTPQQAADLLARLVAHRTHRYWRTLPPVDAGGFTRVLGHQQVQDAYLVHLAERSRGRLATFDRRLAAHAGPDECVVVIPS